MANKNKRRVPLWYDSYTTWTQRVPDGRQFTDFIESRSRGHEYVLLRTTDTPSLCGYILAYVSVRWDKRTTTPLFVLLTLTNGVRDAQKVFMSFEQMRAELQTLKTMLPLHDLENIIVQRGYCESGNEYTVE